MPALILGLLLGLSLTGRAWAGEPSLPPIDLILVIDDSGSMVGKHGGTNIFPEVKATANRLVDWLPAGSNLVLITFGEGAKVYPPAVLYDARERGPMKRTIDTLRANSMYTFTALGLQRAFEEAERLDRMQANQPDGARPKAIILLTDGKDKPPPSAKGKGPKLEEVAKPAEDMDWFVWQVQLGPQIDDSVRTSLQKTMGTRYQEVHAPGAKGLEPAISNTILPRVAELSRRTLHLDPESISFGTVPAGGSLTRQVRVIPDRSGATGRVRLRPEGTGAMDLQIVPNEIVLQGGEGIAQVTLKVRSDAALGDATGVLTLEIIDGSLQAGRSGVPWSAQVVEATRTLQIEPAKAMVPVLRPGGRADFSVSIRGDASRSTARVRLTEGDRAEGVTVDIEPADLTLDASGNGTTKISLEVAPSALPGPRNGTIQLEAIDGAIALAATSVPWSANIEWTPVTFEEMSLALDETTIGAETATEVHLRTAANVPSGKVRLVLAPVRGGVVAEIAPEFIEFGPETTQATARLVVRAPETATEGDVSGSITLETVAGPIVPPTAPLVWQTTILPAPNRLRQAAVLGLLLLLLTIVAAVVWYVRLPRLEGTLRITSAGQNPQTIELGGLPNTREAWIGSAPDCAIPLQNVPAHAARLRAIRQTDNHQCVLDTETANVIRFDGKSFTQLELFDGDEFEIGAYSIRYRSERVARRPTRSV